MGSFRAELKIGGEVYNVLYTKTSFSRDITQRGKVSTGIKGGITELRVDSTSSSLLAEMTVNSQHKPFDYEISFFQAEDESEMKKLTGIHTYIIDYQEVLDTQNQEQINIFIRLASEELTLGDAFLHSNWANNA